MFIDARQLPDGTEVTADLCIIGSGPAGLTVALELLHSGLTVVLLESGGLGLEESTDNLNAGSVSGLPFELQAARSRFFGGSSNCWGGFCRPFEPYHFLQRDWVPNSGWPIDLSNLSAYYARAHAICQLSDNYIAATALRSANRRYAPLPIDDQEIITSICRLNQKTRRLGKLYYSTIKTAGISCYLYANVLECVVLDNCITLVRCPNFTVRARQYVLAAGAIENARLLLASNSSRPAGIGNEHDNVGRYFMAHPTIPIAEITVNSHASLLPYVDRFALLRLPVCAELNLPYSVQSSQLLLDSAVHVNLRLVGEFNAGTLAAKRLFGYVWRGSWPPKSSWRDVLALPSSVRFALGVFTCANFCVQARQLAMSIEQCPNFDSRLMLGSEVDTFGMPRVNLHWQLHPVDVDTLQRAADLYLAELHASKIVTSSTAVADTIPRWNHHSMGTTRMHTNPKYGVVNADCRVHGIGNLYVAGSSIFPTAGNHTPTLTIIALAVRLAEHLRSTFSSAPIEVRDC